MMSDKSIKDSRTTGWFASADAVLRVCKRLDPEAWAYDAEPDAYIERREKSFSQALHEVINNGST